MHLSGFSRGLGRSGDMGWHGNNQGISSLLPVLQFLPGQSFMALPPQPWGSI